MSWNVQSTKVYVFVEHDFSVHILRDSTYLLCTQVMFLMYIHAIMAAWMQHTPYDTYVHEAAAAWPLHAQTQYHTKQESVKDCNFINWSLHTTGTVLEGCSSQSVRAHTCHAKGQHIDLYIIMHTMYSAQHECKSINCSIIYPFSNSP